MKLNFLAKAAVAIVIFSVVGWVYFIAVLIPREINKSVGASLFVFGVFNFLFFRRHARQIWGWSQSESTKLVRIWSAAGRPWIDLLFFGIAVILTVSGVVLWIRGS
jgi:hypothetical protein